MSSTSIFLIFDKPELVEQVARYLSPYDIAQCSTVCEKLARQLEPYLWQHFHAVTAPSTQPLNRGLLQQKRALLRNRHHLWSIDIDGNEVVYLPLLTEGLLDPTLIPRKVASTASSSSSSSSTFSPPVQQRASLGLRSITIHRLPESQGITAQRLLTLTSHCRYLTTLNIPSTVLDQPISYHELFLQTILEDLPNLEQLAILGMGLVEWDRGISFLDACFRHPRLEALKCWFIFNRPRRFYNESPINELLGSMGIPTDHKEGNQEDVNHPNPSRIKDLRLPRFSDNYLDGSLLVPLLRYHGPRLERMNISSLPREPNLQQLQVVSQHCSRLRHLGLNVQQGVLVDLNQLVEAILTGLQNPGLLSFSVRGTNRIRTQSVLFDILIRLHGQTLEEVVTKGFHRKEEPQMRLVTHCPRLKRLWLSLPEIGSALPRALPVPKDEWTCLDLRELCYCYSSSTSEDRTRVLHLQLGRLVKLEVLGIGCIGSSKPLRQIDMMSMHGWLAELAELKELRHLFLMTELWMKSKQAEVEFMDQNWPRLEKITFGFKKERLADIVGQPHWQWLKKKRPWIRYTYWNDTSGYIARGT